MNLGRKMRRTLRRTWDGLWTKRDARVVRVGGASPWAIRTDLLGQDAVIVSGGVGKDVSFEKELAERYGCWVYLFDPSPTGLETMSHADSQHERMSFLPFGLAGRPGTLEFNLPKNPAEGSYTVANERLRTGATKFSCIALSEFVRERNLKRIDVLKLDIEGFEYGVLDDVLRADVSIGQICVEFHHFMPGIGISRTLRCIWRLHRRGFALVSKEMCDYLFVRRANLE